jgi:hypothetical protein
MAAFRSAGYRGDLVESAEDLEDPLSDDEFDREVAKVVERVMQRLRVEGRLPPMEEQQPGQGEGKADPGGRSGAEGEPE